MPKWKTSDPSYDCEITSEESMGADHAVCRAFVDASIAFHRVVPLLRIRFDEAPGLPDEYDWEIVTQDGRTWSQRLKITATQMQQKFDVGEFWEIDEFRWGRPLRDDYLRALVQTAGVTKIKVDWS